MYREKHLCLNSRLLNPNTIKGATKTKFTAQQQQLIQWHQQSQQRAIQESYRKSSNKFRLLLAASWVFQLQLVKNTAALSHHQQCEFWNQLDCSHRGTCELFLFSIRIVVSKHHNFILIHSNSRQDTTRWNDNKAFRMNFSANMMNVVKSYLFWSTMIVLPLIIQGTGHCAGHSSCYSLAWCASVPGCYPSVFGGCYGSGQSCSGNGEIDCNSQYGCYWSSYGGSSSSNSSSSSNNNSGGFITGISVAAGIAIVGAVVIFFLYRRRKLAHPTVPPALPKGDVKPNEEQDIAI